MKKVLLAVFCTIVLTGFSQEEKTWRLGLQLGNQTSNTQFSGGMSDANARFHRNPFGGGAFNIIARFDLNKHWMFMSGLGFNSFGFGYSISENYSLLNKVSSQGQYTSISSKFGALEIPAMVFYKFNPNCKNTRWIVGAGLAQTFIGSQTGTSSASKANDGNSNVNYLSSTSNTHAGNYWYFRWSVGREKTFKKGSIINVSVLFNWGLNHIAESTVNYTIDNQNYTHSFTNSGNFAGFRVAYFFKPFHNPWEKSKRAAVLN